jgi:hypothetical protein
MISKRTLCPERIRKSPAGFNWLDHRLVRDGYIDLCSHQAAALYLFLVTVADVRGLSYYSDVSLRKRLRMDSATLVRARRDLIRIGLIAYKKPLYQVLALEGKSAPAMETSAQKPSARGGMQSLSEILKHLMEGKS